MVTLDCPCLACLTTMEASPADEYRQCPRCASFVYVPAASTAELDNVEYFDKLFAGQIQARRSTPRLALIWGLTRIEGLVTRSHYRMRKLLHHVESMIASSSSALEVGFGRGDFLVKCVERGANMYGIDLSAEAVAEFRRRYPDHADRVGQGDRFSGTYHAIYASALFEHLDKPDLFLQDAAASLLPHGSLILGLPIVRTLPPGRSVDTREINFWKPVHRMLYSVDGLNLLLARHGFRIRTSVTNDMYTYRVMNAMLQNGFHRIEQVRNPYSSGAGLPNARQFLRFAFSALFRQGTSAFATFVIDRTHPPTC